MPSSWTALKSPSDNFHDDVDVDTGTAPSPSSYSYAASSAYTPRARYHRAPHDHDDGGGGGGARNYSHPPGYQQNVHAAEFSSAQLAAHNQSVFYAGGYGDGDEDGVWSTAKRWAAAAGESIMAAEEQIWKKINGD
ncbi:hypothetical protein ESCO_000145 [Escovopsis weberi]|uniref:Uncharacterized protein n=1 Tax=Escovopsis weberi TaxID=150374 RepID=A0A0M8MTU4_ESCWE|nr:hypothetical protein ESCO_000145 [Escovopsis weberi]